MRLSWRLRSFRMPRVCRGSDATRLSASSDGGWCLGLARTRFGAGDADWTFVGACTFTSGMHAGRLDEPLLAPE
jgi:hypothetical protein